MKLFEQRFNWMERALPGSPAFKGADFRVDSSSTPTAGIS